MTTDLDTNRDPRHRIITVPDLSPPIRGLLSGILKGQVTLTKKSVSASIIITAGYAAYVPDELEIASGITLEIGNGGTLEIG